MKLYRAKVPAVAKEVLDALTIENDIEVAPECREEAEADVASIMEEYLRREGALRNRVRDRMDSRGLPYNAYGQTRKQMAEEMNQPMGDDVERFLARQFIEVLMISPNVEEVYEEDEVMYKKVIEVLRSNNVDEREIREEAASKVKNVQEGTVEYEIALQHAVRDVKKRRGLI